MQLGTKINIIFHSFFLDYPYQYEDQVSMKLCMVSNDKASLRELSVTGHFISG